MNKKTSDQWLKEPQFLGYVVMDPDGWDRMRFDKSWTEEITEEEFNKRLMRSTIMREKVEEQTNV